MWIRIVSALGIVALLAAAPLQAATFTVLNTGDSGPGSLRDAITQANDGVTNPPPNTIVFDPSVTGTITLTSGQLQIKQGPLTITGPGAGVLAVIANPSPRVFAIFNTNPACPALDGPDYLVSISGLRLSNARRVTMPFGGAILSQHSLVLGGVTIDNSLAAVGGGMAFQLQYPGQSLTINNSQFLTNGALIGAAPATVAGGALAIVEKCSNPPPAAQIHTTPVTVAIANTLFSGNDAGPIAQSGFGGAIFTISQADISITDSRLVGNHVIVPNPPVAGQNYQGGAFWGGAKSLTLTRTEVSGNRTVDASGSFVTRAGAIGILNNLFDLQGPANAFHVNIVNSTISSNEDAGFAGAIGAYGNVALDIENSTIKDNEAPAGNTGGIRLQTGPTNGVPPGIADPPTLNLVSSIVADNAADDIATDLASIPTFTVNASHSMIGSICPTPTCAISVAGSANLLGVAETFLGPLAFNGGPTQTHAPVDKSPAIDAGSNPLAIATDQRGTGFARTLGATTDIGAFETHPLVVTNNSDSQPGSLRDVVAQANADPGPNTITFDPAVTGTILLTSGQIVITDPVSIIGPGSGTLTIDGNANNRIFSILDPNPTPPPCPAPSGPNDYLVTMSGLTLANASRNSDNDGGAIGTEESLAMLDVVFTGNKAKNGGGLVFRTNHPRQQLYIADSQFINNIAMPRSAITGATNAGGAIYIREQCPGNYTKPVDVEIVNTLFSGNRSQPVALWGVGGAIASLSAADISISNSRFVGNGVDAPIPNIPNALYGGGAVFGRAKSVSIDGSEISGNTANLGAGLFIANSDPTLQTPATAILATIVNSTISGNVASVSSGAALIYGNVALEFDNSTLANNLADATHSGGVGITTGPTNPVSGGNAATGTLTLVSTIVGNNSVYDIADDVTVIPTFTVNATNSLIETMCPSPTCVISVVGSGNKTGLDPMLGPLANNGGTTQTQALLAGSPAINAGSNPLALTTDQRGAGFPRVFGGVADMGAFESVFVAVPPVLQSAKSRRVHGAAGTFDLPLTITPTGTVNHAPATEPRQGPNQTIVFTFDKPLNAATVTITEGTATAAAPTFSGNDVVVGLTGVTDHQYVTVTLTNVVSTDGGTGGSAEARIGFLVGDVNQTRVVSLADLGLVNGQLAQVVTAANYLKDVNASGTLTLADKGITNQNLTKALPAP